MLYVKFIQNWNSSELTNTGTPETPTYTYGELKNTFVYTDGLKLVNINYDAESYIADDFFLRQPREAKIELFRDDDDWLRDNFLYHNDNEINHVLYMDENGVILEYEGVDPGLSIGETLDNGTIDAKEVLIQQFSKIIVEIYDTNKGAEPVFTGLVDKSQTSSTHRRITLNCIDFTGLIRLFGDQLIKIISGLEDDDYKYLVSHTTVNELMDKIKDFTKLEIEYSNSINDYLSPDDSITDIGILDLITDIAIPDVNDIGTLHSNYVEGSAALYSSEQIFADSINDVFVVFTAYTYDSLYYYDDGSQGGVIDETTTHLIVIYKTVTASLDISAHNRIDYDLYTIDNISGNIINQDMTGESAVNTFKNYFNSDSAFIVGESLYIYDLNSGTTFEYTFYDIIQSRYKLVIPIYADTYKYIELLKTILFLNILTIYANGDGDIIVINKNFTEQEAGASTTINERDIIDGYSLSAIEKDELEMSNALEKVWYDYDSEPPGLLYNNLDNTMKEELSELFLTRFPLEFNGDIKYSSVDIGTINSISVGNKLKFFDRYWIIISAQLNKTSFSTKIKAYGLTVYTLINGETFSASSELSSYYLVENAFDQDETTWWNSEFAAPSPAHWIKCDLGSGNGAVVAKYSIRTSLPPTAWKLQGSNDDLIWVDLDEQSNYYDWESFEYIKILSNINSYRWYRLYATEAQSGAGWITMTELELWSK